SMQRLVLTAGSLIADFQLSHRGIGKGGLDEQLANSPFTRTWGLYERVAEAKDTPPTRATPPAGLRDAESFASLEAVDIPAALRAEEEAPKVLPLTAFEEEAPALRRVGTPEESRRGPLETTTVVGARPVTPPAALRDSESFASLEAVDIPAALRAEEEAPKVLPLTAFEEEAPALRRVGTPEEPQMGLAVTAHRVRLDGDLWGRVVDEWPDLLEQEFTSDVCDATGLPPTSMQRLVLTAGSLIADFQLSHRGIGKGGLDEQLANSPFTRTWGLYERVAEAKDTPPTRATPPAGLRDAESFASLEAVDIPAALRAEEEAPKVLPLTAFEEEAPALRRVGTPEESRRGPLETTTVVGARPVTPPAALRDSESFASLEAVGIPAALRAEEEAPKVLPLTAFEEEAPALRRVGTPEESRRGPLETTTVVGARPVTPPAALRDSESFASLEAVDIPAALRAEEEAPKVLPLTAFEEEAPALRRVGTPEEPQMGLAVTAHRVRLDGDLWGRVVDEWPDLLEQEFTSDVCDATGLPPTSMQRLVLTAGSLIADFQLSHRGIGKGGLDEQLANSPFTRTWGLYERVAEAKDTPPTGGTPPAVVCDSESFASLEAVDIPAALHAPEQDEAPAAERAAEPQETRMAASAEARPSRELWQSVAEPEGYSRSDLGCAEPAALHAPEQDEAPAAERAAEPQETRMAASAEARPSRELWQSVAEPEGYSRSDLGCAEPAALHAPEQDEAPAAERAAEPQETRMAASAEARPSRELWQSVAEPEGYSRSDLGCAEPAALHAPEQDEAPAAERAAEPQETRMAASAEARPSRELWQSVAEPEGYSRSDLGCAEPAALHAPEQDEAPAAERAAEPQETRMAASAEARPSRELWQSVAEPEGYSRSDLGCAEPAALHAPEQ
ncbi:uncharacterized protein, partial [Leishmania mexicana MHOM/GT/2001/U1103]